MHIVSLLHARINMYKCLSKPTSRTWRTTWSLTAPKMAPESAPKSAPINVLTNHIQSAKTRFLRGAKDECRRHGSLTSRTPWSALFGRDTESTFESIFGNIFRHAFRPTFRFTLGALFGELFDVLVGASIAKISQQPTSKKPHAAEQNQHSAKLFELTARNDALKQKVTLFFLACMRRCWRRNAIALPISRILFCKTSDFWESEIFLR